MAAGTSHATSRAPVGCVLAVHMATVAAAERAAEDARWKALSVSTDYDEPA
jgi:hypothetical protein